MAQWEKEAASSPVLLGAIARHYKSLGKDGEAERLLLQYIERWPEFWAYATLAEIYQQKHNTSRWLEVLDRFLAQTDDPGLNQAQVRVAIATYYMDQKQWEKARPYADAAAETGEAWALVCAQTCAEGRNDWEQAEKWARATSERYPSVAWDRWFNLCRKSGTGDVDAAVALASQWVAENMQGAPSDPLERITSFYLSSFELKKALPILERLYRRSPSAEACALAWLVADLLDDHAARDRYFELMATRHKTESPRTAATWRRLHDAVKRDGGGSLDLRAIADERDSSHPNRAWLNDFIIGMFLEKRGRPVEAREFLQRAAGRPPSDVRLAFDTGLIEEIAESVAAVARDTIRKIDQHATGPKSAANPAP